MKKMIEILKSRKTIALLCCLTALILCMVGCSKDPENPVDSGVPSDSTSGDTGNPNDPSTPEGPTVEIDMNQYVVLYDDKANDLVKDIATKFAEKCSTPLGIDLAIDMDNEWNTPQSKELLIGLSNRSEAQTALDKTAGAFTYNISMIGEKICVAAPTAELIQDALDYLYDNYISKSTGNGKFLLTENISYTPKELDHITMVEKGNCLFNVVYPKGATVGTPVSVAAIEIRDFLQTHTNAEQEVALLGDYANSLGQFDLTQPSVVIGNTEYPRSAEISKNMTYFGWQMEYLDNQFYLYCEDVASTKVLLAEMKNLMANAVYLDGSNTIRMCIPETKSGFYADWCQEIPEYVPVEGETDVYMETISEFTEGYYRLYLDKVTPAGFESYLNLVKSSGYTVYQEDSVTNKNNTSKFVTLKGNKTVLHLYYLAHQKALRVLVCEKSNFVDYATAPVQLADVVKPTLTVMDMEYIKQGAQDNGLGLIYTLKDGSYIIYDGGYSYDTEKLYNYLKDNNKYGDGTRIYIRAWVLTHPHLDHYGNYVEFAKLYGNVVTLENAVYQFDYEGAMNPNMTAMDNATSAALKEILTEVDIATTQFIGSKRIVPMAGQTLWFGDVGIEIMATSEMLFPVSTSNQNDHSMITRVHMAGNTFMVTGDTASAPMHMKTLERVYGAALQSTFMTAPHHGLNGSDSFFLLIRPEYVIFHTETDDFEKRISTEGGVGCNMLLVDELKKHELFKKGESAEDGFVKEFIVADNGAANGYHVLLLPFMGSDYYESNFGDGNYDQDQDQDSWEDITK